MARRYSDKQAAEILSRAAELSVREAPASGPTLDELERIAVEAGLDPAAVRRAATEMDRGGPSSSTTTSKLAGAPSHIVFETEIAGELDTKGHEQLAELLARRFPGGQPSVVGRTFTWKLVRSVSARGGRRADEVTVVVSSRDDRTTVRVEEQVGGLLRRTFGASLGASVGAAMAFLPIIVDSIAHGAVAAPVIVFGAVGAGVAGGYGLARTLFARRVHGRQDELQALFNEVCDVAAAAVPANVTATMAPAATSSAATTTTAASDTESLDAARARLLGEAAARPVLAEDSAAVVVEEAAAVARK